MIVLVLLTHRLRSIFAHKSANPFYYFPHPLSPTCMVACLFCGGNYGDIFPTLIQGVKTVMFDLFLGEIELRIDQVYSIECNIGLPQ